MSIRKADASPRDPEDYKVKRVSTLRRELEGHGLKVDGSRETLIKRLEAYDAIESEPSGDHAVGEDDGEDGAGFGNADANDNENEDGNGEGEE